MTRALRRRHRIAIAVLAVVLPVGLAVALVVRPVLPPVAGHGALAGASAERTVMRAKAVNIRPGDEGAR